jgi:hypothetical protein
VLSRLTQRRSFLGAPSTVRRAMASPEPVPYEQSLFATLAEDDVREIFSLLPVDTRLRCREVCPAWCELLDHAPSWFIMDLSPRSGVAPRNVSMGLLRALKERSKGLVEVLDVSNCGALVYDAETGIFNPEFLAFLSGLRMVGNLVWRDYENVPESAVLAQFLAAAHLAETVCVNVFVTSFKTACSMLRHEPPFAALCPHYFCLQLDVPTVCDWPTFASLLPKCSKVDHLNLICADLRTPGHLDSIVDAAIAMELCSLEILHSKLDPSTAVRALSRLLRGGCIVRLEVLQCPFVTNILDHDESFAAELAAALRSSSELQDVTLGGIGLWSDAAGDMAAGRAIVEALSGHPSLRAVTLCCNRAPRDHYRDVYAALVALVNASPELRMVNVRGVFQRGDEDDSDSDSTDSNPPGRVWLSAFHNSALAINPSLQLPSLEDAEEEEESADSEEEGSGEWYTDDE